MKSEDRFLTMFCLCIMGCVAALASVYVGALFGVALIVLAWRSK